MTVLIVLTTAGTNTGPFNLFSNLDGYTTAFESGVAKSALVAGYTSTLVPDGTTNIRVQSVGACTNFIDIAIGAVPTTTTTTTGGTAILSVSYVGGNGVDTNGQFYFNLSSALSSNVTITGASVNEFANPGCTGATGSASQAGMATITAGNLNTIVNSNSGVCPGSFSFVGGITVNGTPLTDGGTIVIGGTTVTISIPSTCGSGCLA